MLNTCSIGRRWKPREGWSRPVLTGERGTLSNPFLCGGLGLVLWWFLSLDGKEHCFLVVTMTIPVKRLVVRVRCPVPGPPRSESVVWLVSVPPVRWFPSDRCIGFAVVMAQVRRPVPFRTRKLRPGRGDGTALERVWESSTPPHSTSGFPSSVTLREPFFCLLVLVSRGAREAPNPQHPCIAWSVSVTVSNDVMRLTRYARAGSRESRYDGKRQKPDN